MGLRMAQVQREQLTKRRARILALALGSRRAGKKSTVKLNFVRRHYTEFKKTQNKMIEQTEQLISDLEAEQIAATPPQARISQFD